MPGPAVLFEIGIQEDGGAEIVGVRIPLNIEHSYKPVAEKIIIDEHGNQHEVFVNWSSDHSNQISISATPTTVAPPILNERPFETMYVFNMGTNLLEPDSSISKYAYIFPEDFRRQLSILKDVLGEALCLQIEEHYELGAQGLMEISRASAEAQAAAEKAHEVAVPDRSSEVLKDVIKDYLFFRPPVAPISSKNNDNTSENDEENKPPTRAP